MQPVFPTPLLIACSRKRIVKPSDVYRHGRPILINGRLQSDGQSPLQIRQRSPQKQSLPQRYSSPSKKMSTVGDDRGTSVAAAGEGGQSRRNPLRKTRKNEVFTARGGATQEMISGASARLQAISGIINKSAYETLFNVLPQAVGIDNTRVSDCRSLSGIAPGEVAAVMKRVFRQTSKMKLFGNSYTSEPFNTTMSPMAFNKRASLEAIPTAAVVAAVESEAQLVQSQEHQSSSRIKEEAASLVDQKLRQLSKTVSYDEKVKQHIDTMALNEKRGVLLEGSRYNKRPLSGMSLSMASSGEVRPYIAAARRLDQLMQSLNSRHAWLELSNHKKHEDDASRLKEELIREKEQMKAQQQQKVKSEIHSADQSDCSDTEGHLDGFLQRRYEDNHTPVWVQQQRHHHPLLNQQQQQQHQQQLTVRRAIRSQSAMNTTTFSTMLPLPIGLGSLKRIVCKPKKSTGRRRAVVAATTTEPTTLATVPIQEQQFTGGSQMIVDPRMIPLMFENAMFRDFKTAVVVHSEFRVERNATRTGEQFESQLLVRKKLQQVRSPKKTARANQSPPPIKEVMTKSTKIMTEEQTFELPADQPAIRQHTAPSRIAWGDNVPLLSVATAANQLPHLRRLKQRSKAGGGAVGDKRSATITNWNMDDLVRISSAEARTINGVRSAVQGSQNTPMI